MEFRVLGTVEVVVDGAPVELAGRRRERCLLGVLLLNLGATVPIGRLTDLLWGEYPPARSRSALQVLASRLRSGLAAAGAERYGVRLVTRAGGYVLEGDPERVDAHRFRRLCDRARTVPDPAGRLTLLREALALWQGPPLADAATEQVRRVVLPAWEELRLDATEGRLDCQLSLGEDADVVDELRALVAEYPHRERLVELLMLGLYRAGRRQDALAVYDAARRELAERVGLDPTPALRDLHRAITHSDPALDLAPRVLGARPAQLPPAVPDFTGRGHQLDALDGLADQPGAVVISTVGGVGGVGKTALALHWAHRTRHSYPDGQLHINLHGYSTSAPVTPTEALSRFLRALGVPPEQVPTELEEAAALYRSRTADLRLLVVLDNARHADQVRPLLPSGPGSLALITSRDRLPGLTARDGARRLTLGILSPAEAVDLLVAVIGPERVAAEPEAAGRLVELCGRLPLAVRITAAQLAERPVLRLTRHAAELAAGDRLAALALPEDDDASVRVAFGHSYTGLKPEAARLFRLLALVPGPDFGAGAAAAVGGIGRPEATRLLNTLVTAHLIEPHGSDRYGFHDLMRLYAADQLVGDLERGSAIRRFYHWYVVSADAAAWRLSPERLHLPIPAHFSPAEPVEFADREQALAWCDAERDSFHAAVTGPPEGTDPEAVWLLAEGVRYYFLFRLYMGPALEMAYAALAAARDCPDPRVRAATHYSVATQLREREDYAGAISHFDRALALAREGGLTTEQAVYLMRAATSLRYEGRLAEAADRFAEALPLFALKDEDRDGYAVNQCLLADLYRYLGRYPEALDLMTAGVATLAELRPNLASQHGPNLGNILLDLGRDEEALACFERALADARAIEYLASELQVLPRLSCAHRRLGRPEEARRLAEAALELCERLPAAAVESEARSILAVLHAERGETEQALAHAYEAVRLCGKLPVSEARARAVLARVLLDTGDRAAAAEQAARAARDSRACGYRIALARSLAVLGEATGDASHAAESAALHAELGVPYHDI